PFIEILIALGKSEDRILIKKRERQVQLHISVNHEDFSSELRQPIPHIGTGGGFPASAFIICKTDHFRRHRRRLLSSTPCEPVPARNSCQSDGSTPHKRLSRRNHLPEHPVLLYNTMPGLPCSAFGISSTVRPLPSGSRGQCHACWTACPPDRSSAPQRTLLSAC